MPFAEYTNMVLDFVRAHPNWAAFIVFGLAFGESLAFVSLILPFWAMLVGIGTIVGAADTLSFWTIVSSAAAGAALGDWLSYWLGYHYHEQIEGMWPLSEPQDHGRQRQTFLQALGRLGHHPRALLRSAQGHRADRGRHRADAAIGCSSSPTGARRSCGPSCCSRPARSA